MKSLFATLLLMASLAQAQIVTPSGRGAWGDSVKWGDSDDSTGYLRLRGNALTKDSSGTWVTITTDSCSKAVPIARGGQYPAGKLEYSYEVRTSSGNTDSSQAKVRIDSRYCLDERRSLGCESWVPAGRWKGDTASVISDSLVTVATADGTTWKPTRQIFDVPGGNQIRLCFDSYQAGGATGDTTFFRKQIVRTSSIPSGGMPPGSGGGSGSTITTFPDNEPFNLAQVGGTSVVTGGVNGSQGVGGLAAHDAAAAGNPLRAGGRARTADVTAVSQDDLTDQLHTILGKQVVMPYALSGLRWSYAAASGGITDASAVTIKAAGGAGVKNCITSIQVINGHASTSTAVSIRDGSGGTVLHRGWAQSGGGGYAAHFPVPICGTAATLLEVICGTTGTATYVNAQGYEAAE